MQKIQRIVRYVDDKIEPRHRTMSRHIDEAMKHEKNSKITLHHPTRGTTNFFLITVGGKSIPHTRMIYPEKTYFFTTHKRKNRWTVSAPKKLLSSWSKELQNQISAKLQKGYKLITEDSEKNYDTFEVSVRSTTEITIITDIGSKDRQEEVREEEITLIDMMLM